jgi:hypothetical protein
MFLQLRELSGEVAQFQRLTLALQLPDGAVAVEAEVLQVMPGAGLAVRLPGAATARTLAGGAAARADAVPPSVTDGAAADEGPEEGPAEEERPAVTGPAVPRGMGPASWPIEKLQVEWKNLSMPDRIAVARRGKRAARGLVLKHPDKKLHQFVLQNPELTPQEVAAMVGNPNLDPTMLRRIAGSPEWVRHAAVARALVCHPKMSLPQVTKLLRHLPQAELRRLTRTGRVRASVKRIIIKHVEGGRR